MWGGHCCLASYIPIVDMCLSCEDIARQSCATVPRWRIFWVLYSQRAVCSIFETCILNSHEGHTMCGSMVDIQSVMAEIRRGQKKKKIEETTVQKYDVRICYSGRPKEGRRKPQLRRAAILTALQLFSSVWTRHHSVSVWHQQSRDTMHCFICTHALSLSHQHHFISYKWTPC